MRSLQGTVAVKEPLSVDFDPLLLLDILLGLLARGGPNRDLRPNCGPFASNLDSFVL